MKLALNGATIMHSPLADDVAIAAEAGFAALEIWAQKLDFYLDQNSGEDLAQQMATLGVRPWCINSIEDITHRDAHGRRDVTARLERLARLARVVGAPSIVVVPGRRPPGADARASVRDAVDVLRMMSDAADDIALAFEFLGKPGCAIPQLDMAIEIVSAVDRANVGMVIDTFHFHAGESSLSDLASVPVDKLLVVHLNGCQDLPREQLSDANRLYPGEGPIPIDAILRSLRQLGFDGMASVEIFRPAYWELDPRVVARMAFAKAADVLATAGYTLDG